MTTTQIIALHLATLALAIAWYAWKHRKLIDNYIYFRKRRFGHKDALHLARDTL